MKGYGLSSNIQATADVAITSITINSVKSSGGTGTTSAIKNSYTITGMTVVFTSAKDSKTINATLANGTWTINSVS